MPPGKALDYLDLVVIGEDRRDQGSALGYGEGTPDQLFPRQKPTARRDPVKRMKKRSLKQKKHRPGENLRDFRDFRAQVRLLIPAALHQPPQTPGERWMRGAGRTPALCYMCNSREG